MSRWLRARRTLPGSCKIACSLRHACRLHRQEDQVVRLISTGGVDLEGAAGNTSRGWKGSEGAADSIAATQLFTSTCQSLNPNRFVNTAFGVSMGGNMTGLAVSESAKRGDGSTLFDYWFDVAGVTDVPEIYTDATAISLVPLGGIQTTGANAKADIESDQMVAALALAGIPTGYTTSIFKAPESPPGLTLDGDVLGLIPGYVSPFAGHVNEIVIGAALNRLDALYQEGKASSGLKLTLEDGSLGTFPLL